MKKVLVADDTKNIRLLLSKCLQMEGYEVKTANDGFEATDLLLKEAFDLAFLDIKMPNLSGTEVIRTIRGRGIRMPVIVITAYGTVRNAVECTQLGAVAYLQKPFTADKIRAVLKEYQDGTSCGSSMELVRELVAKKEYAQALQILDPIMSGLITEPEVYLLLSEIYGGLGNKELERKFHRTFELFSGS